LAGGGFVGVVAEAHEDADAVVALLLEEGGGDGGVDTAGHGDDDFAFWFRIGGHVYLNRRFGEVAL